MSDYPRKDLQTELLSLRASLFDGNTRLPVYSACFERLKAMAEDRYLGVILLQISDLERLEAVVGFERYESILRRAAFHVQDLNNREFNGELLLAQRGVYDDQFTVFVPYRVLNHGAVATLDRVSKRLFRALEDDLKPTDHPGLSLHLGVSMLHYNPFLRFERLVHRVVEETAVAAQHQQETEAVLHELELRQILSRPAITSVYHPIVSLEGFEILGFEALARGPANTPYHWPEALFSFARQSKLSYQLDHQCKMAALAGVRGKPKGALLFVNTLPSTLADETFTGEEASELLHRSGLTASDVVWELTERHAIGDYETFRTLMGRYLEMGYRVAIDDVGTGFSSIQTITHVRPLYLKVDISLVKDVDQHLLKQELISSLLILGRNIGAQVIAEGVSTTRELDALRELGVVFGQGFLFGHPSEAFPARVTPSP